MSSEEISNLADGQVQIILRSEHKAEVEALMMRHTDKVAEGGGLLQWVGPIRSPSNTWTAYARGPAYLWPVGRRCGDEATANEVENCPEVYGDNNERVK